RLAGRAQSGVGRILRGVPDGVHGHADGSTELVHRPGARRVLHPSQDDLGEARVQAVDRGSPGAHAGAPAPASGPGRPAKGALKFIGLANYAYVLAWPDFAIMVKNTIVMTAGAIFFKLCYGMVGALVLNESLRGRGLYRALVILPWATPGLVAALLWRWMMD